MEADKDRLIVCDGRCACGTVHTKQIHHRDFPEIWAEGGTVREGAEYLRQQLQRARERALIDWHRAAVNRALADLDEFLRALIEVEFSPPRNEDCTCGRKSVRRHATLSRP